MTTEQIAFIGKKTVTDEEKASLTNLAQAMARAGFHLHLVLAGASNLHLNTEFKKAGGKSTTHQRDLLKVTPDTILFVDETKLDEIRQANPDLPHHMWIHVHNVTGLDDLANRINQYHDNGHQAIA
jgi:hypothetical protein